LQLIDERAELPRKAVREPGASSVKKGPREHKGKISNNKATTLRSHISKLAQLPGKLPSQGAQA
jgi:hypothetical protein